MAVPALSRRNESKASFGPLAICTDRIVEAAISDTRFNIPWFYIRILTCQTAIYVIRHALLCGYKPGFLECTYPQRSSLLWPAWNF